MKTNLLESIWRNDVSLSTGRSARRVRQMLKAFTPLRVIVLESIRPLAHAGFYSDNAEVMPGLPLGDVLAEELGIEVPYGSLIVVLDHAAMHGRGLSRQLGTVLGDLLVHVLSQGIFPLRREAAALYLMACSSVTRSGSERLGRLGLDPQAFEDGLSGPLGRYWKGPEHGLSARELLDPSRLRSLVKTVDLGFAAPDPAQVSAELLANDVCPPSPSNWISTIESRVLAELADHEAKLCSS